METNRKRKQFSLEDKYKLVMLIENNEKTQAEISRKYSIKTSTLSEWCSRDVKQRIIRRGYV